MWIQNLSNTQLPEYVRETLKLGPNFATSVTSKHIPIHSIIANIEDGIEHHDNDSKDIYF